MFAPKLTRSKTSTAVKQTNKSAVPKPTPRMPGGDRQDDSERANLAVPQANPHLSWDFPKFRLFASAQTGDRTRRRSART